jgi:hypothetical protein
MDGINKEKIVSKNKKMFWLHNKGKNEKSLKTFEKVTSHTSNDIREETQSPQCLNKHRKRDNIKRAKGDSKFIWRIRDKFEASSRRDRSPSPPRTPPPPPRQRRRQARHRQPERRWRRRRRRPSPLLRDRSATLSARLLLVFVLVIIIVMLLLLLCCCCCFCCCYRTDGAFGIVVGGQGDGNDVLVAVDEQMRQRGERRVGDGERERRNARHALHECRHDVVLRDFDHVDATVVVVVVVELRYEYKHVFSCAIGITCRSSRCRRLVRQSNRR